MPDSFFLFGPRGTGKSTLLRDHFDESIAVRFDLLDPNLEDAFLRNADELERRIDKLSAGIRWVLLDEIQKAPRVLDSVHRAIETRGLLFALTGSSARKLKRGGANLLAGRAFVNHLHPLTHREIGSGFDLEQALHFGTLPKILGMDGAEAEAEFLRAYALRMPALAGGPAGVGMLKGIGGPLPTRISIVRSTRAWRSAAYPEQGWAAPLAAFPIRF